MLVGEVHKSLKDGRTVIEQSRHRSSTSYKRHKRIRARGVYNASIQPLIRRVSKYTRD